MGQFMDHDMTFDIGSSLGVPTEAQSVTNGRTRAFDLDSLYGGGPRATRGRSSPANGLWGDLRPGAHPPRPGGCS